MEIHRYVADSIPEGLMTVRGELGRDAVIVSVQEKKNGLAGKRRRVEILARRPDEDQDAPENAKDDYEAKPVVAENTSAPASVHSDAERKEAEQLLSQLYAEMAPAEDKARPLHNARAARSTTSHRAATTTVTDSVADSYDTEETEETEETEDYIHPTASVKESQGNWHQTAFSPEPIASVPLPDPNSLKKPMPPQVTSLYFYLLDTGVQPDIAQEMLNRLCSRFNPHKPWQPQKVQTFLNSLVAGNVRTGGALGKTRKRRIAALIGPTGVGKTTTIAKIAAGLARQNISVGLITVDNFRVGAVDQLRKFADSSRIPLLAASNKRDFQQAIRAFKSRNVTLVDTAGQNPRDMELLERLSQTLDSVPGIERHLVLSAPTKERDLVSFSELYDQIGYHYMVFSKLDETVTYGGLLNAYMAAKRPFSYFTTGQRVPEDIEQATSKRLNELLFH